jgi:NADH-quinone oxidoreductase subunit H
MGKEVLIPAQANRIMFIGAPIVGMAGVLILSTMLCMTAILRDAFVGDIIVAVYLMVLPSLALILGSSASASPHAVLGASREMKLVMGYELPLVLALVIVLIKVNTVADPESVKALLSLTKISSVAPVASISGFLAFFVSLLCIQAKLGYVPFDIAESETELASGVLIEYSGALLAIWKIMQAMMLVALPMFVVMAFLGGFGSSIGSIIGGVLKYVLVVVLVVLIKNTNPRVRIDQAMRFFWVFCGLVLSIAVILALIGNIYDISWL